MEFCYSEEIDASRYETHDLDHGIPLRMHKDSVKEINGALRAQKDWTHYVRPVHGYKGGLANPYGFISVTIPECRPERLEVVSYANEFAFLYDGLSLHLIGRWGYTNPLQMTWKCLNLRTRQKILIVFFSRL